MARSIREIALVRGDDGIVFDPNSVETEVIKEDAEYEGVRAKLVATLDQAKIRMRIDVGFGDAVQPEPRTSQFPTVLKRIEPPILRMYPPEVVIAEKLHAMVVLDIRNSRMKDFFDLWYLARTRSFDLSTLRRAVVATFDRRRTPVPTEIPFALTDGFLTDEIQDAAVARIPSTPPTRIGNAESTGGRNADRTACKTSLNRQKWEAHVARWWSMVRIG